MPAGTIALTNKSATVAGTGTSFTTELKAGDFVYVNVGGAPYTLVAANITSDTQLTLAVAFDGPTTSGLAWNAVPASLQVAITQKILNDFASVARGRILDFQNWQKIYSDAESVDVVRPDRTTFTGPSWGYMSAQYASKADKADLDKKADITALDTKADKTALDAYAKNGNNSDIKQLSGLTTALSVAQGGTGGSTTKLAKDSLSFTGDKMVTFRSRIADMVFDLNAYGSTVFRQDAGLTVAGANIQYSPGLFAVVADTYSAINVGYSTGIVTAISGQYGQTLFQNRLWGTANTVIDGNGFIKTASPIVKIFSDGNFETNEESEGVKVTRKSEGVYQIKNCLGLNADGAWGGADGGFEIPVDRNKQPSVWLDYEVNADGSLLIKTFHRTHPDAPEFAQNNKEGYVNGQPVDIPATQFLSVRVQMPDNSKWNAKQAEYRERAEKAAQPAD